MDNFASALARWRMTCRFSKWDIQYLPLSNLLDAGAILSKSLKELDKMESN